LFYQAVILSYIFVLHLILIFIYTNYSSNVYSEIERTNVMDNMYIA